MITELALLPRPARDTGLSLRFEGWPRQDEGSFGAWLDALGELGATWVVLPGTLDAPVPEAIVRALRSREIEPVVELDARPIGPFDPDRLRARCRDYASWGGRYLALYRHPNLVGAWQPADWARPGLVERFAAALGPALEVACAEGLFPLLGPLAPGGHYWDLSFLGRTLDALARDCRRAVLDRFGVCYHWATSNRPLDWGAGGPARWSDVRPYHLAPGGEDHRGFNLFAWYDAIVRERLGRARPLLCASVGPVPGWGDDPTLPALDAIEESGRATDVAELLERGEIPDHVLAVGAWSSPVSSAPGAVALADLPRLKVLPRHAPRGATPPGLADDPSGSAATSSPGTEPATSGVAHYLLVHIPEDPAFMGVWSCQSVIAAAVDYVERFRPTIGFSPREAARARHVTLVGPDSLSLGNLAGALRASPATLDLLAAASPRDLKRALDDRVASGRPFAK